MTVTTRNRTPGSPLAAHAAIRPSSRLAGGALCRSRCSREVVHGLAGLVLAGALTLAESLPASGQSRADSAAVLLGTAEAMERRGSEELALALLQYLASRFPDTESGRVAASRAESTKREAGARGGETELKVWGAAYGIWLGLATRAAFGADDQPTNGAALLLGGPTGFLLGRSLANSRPVSPGQARAITWGGAWGGLQGLVVAGIAGKIHDDDSSERVFTSMLLGSIVGVAGGLAAAQGDISPGTATSAMFGSLWGTWFGVAGAILADLEDQAAWTTVALTGNAGLAVGAAIGSRVPLSRPRAWTVSVGGLLGAFGGAGLALIAGVDNSVDDEDKGIVGLALAGGVAGLAIAAAATGGDEADGASSRSPSGEALLNRLSGEWFLAKPLPSPVAGLVARGPGAGERTVSWRVPLLSARF